jgi:hypothetical protein
MNDLNTIKRYPIKILNFLGQFFMDGLGVFVEAVDVKETEGFDESVDSADSMFFVIELGAGLAEEALVEAELVKAEVLDGVLVVGEDFAVVLFDFDSF